MKVQWLRLSSQLNWNWCRSIAGSDLEHVIGLFGGKPVAKRIG